MRLFYVSKIKSEIAFKKKRFRGYALVFAQCDGLPLAAGPVSRYLIAKVSVCLREVKINEANAQ
jgi:hypothetical protein